MPITIDTPEPEAINSARDFWDKIAKPDYEDFRDNTADLRTAFHAAVSLFHVSDWVWKDNENKRHAVFDVNDEYKLRDYIIDKECPDFELIRDVANSSKHFRLSPPSAKRPPKKVPSATKITSQTTGFGVGPYGEGTFGGTLQVIVEVSGDMRPLSAIAKNVYEMWDRLFEAKGW